MQSRVRVPRVDTGAQSHAVHVFYRHAMSRAAAAAAISLVHLMSVTNPAVPRALQRCGRPKNESDAVLRVSISERSRETIPPLWLPTTVRSQWRYGLPASLAHAEHREDAVIMYELSNVGFKQYSCSTQDWLQLLCWKR